MTVADQYPDLICEVAFTTTPADDDPDWEDVTEDLRAATTKRGRQQELDRYQAGSCDVVLANAGRAYDPENDDGDHWPDVKPMRRMRLQATWDSTTYPIIDAYTDRWQQDYDPPNDATATLAATDGFKILNKKALPASAYVAEVAADSPVLWWRLGDTSGSTSVIDSMQAQPARVLGTPTLAATGLIAHDPDGAVQTADSQDGAYTDGTFPIASGYPITLSAVIKTTSVVASLIVTLIDNNGNKVMDLRSNGTKAWVTARRTSGSDSEVFGTSTIVDGDPHLIVGQIDGSGDIHVFVDGAEENTPVALTSAAGAPVRVLIAGGVPYSGGPSIGLIGTIDEIVMFATAVSSTRIAAWAAARSAPWAGDTPAARLSRVLDLVAWPAGLRDLDTGQSTLQSADIEGSTALEQAQKVAASDFGEFYMSRDGEARLVERTGLINRPLAATFGDGPGELGYQSITFDNGDELIRNPVTVSRTEGVAQTVSDAAGITEYLDHQYTLDGLLHNSDTLSRDAADFLVSEYKDPKTRVVGLVVAPAADPDNLWPVVLDLELGDVVTIVRRPQGVGDPISQDCEVQAIAHDISPGSWRTTLTLSPAYTGAFLQLDLTSGPGLDALRLYF